MSRPSLLRRVWDAISEPRRLKVAFFLAYLIALYVGVVTFIQPPGSIEDPLGELTTRFWAMLYVLGGAGGAATVLQGWWLWERLAVWLSMTGGAIYALTAIYLHVTGPPTAQRLTQAGVIILSLFVYVIRLLLTREWDYEPRRRE